MKHIDIDSLKHLGINAACPVVGAAIGTLIGWAAGYTFIGFVAGLAFGIGVGIGASLTREYDGLQFYGHWCWWDIVFDFLGLLCGSGIIILIAWLIWK